MPAHLNLPQYYRSSRETGGIGACPAAARGTSLVPHQSVLGTREVSRTALLNPVEQLDVTIHQIQTVAINWPVPGAVEWCFFCFDSRSSSRLSTEPPTAPRHGADSWAVPQLDGAALPRRSLGLPLVPSRSDARPLL